MINFKQNNVEQNEIESIVTNVNDNNINNANMVEPFIYSITNRNLIFPIFTTSHFVETGLLKLLNNAQAFTKMTSSDVTKYQIY